ncbi:P-type conjugative transfer protein TrbG [Pseudorhizobium endolithicum]|uniref:P-type conjugative transfer protein TrbG n=1 Tax=Pseudorhizobium endolithicum TaxID=1191678 RepID=A0ABM8PL99_9HYPH|nr:P-type conjugative transfer protein TrbG [Pseudorhizobium endolithicum]CAD7036206.1 P-type conjugative transfer protein TrbG [Pseudorhizobium endolithicum]
MGRTGMTAGACMIVLALAIGANAQDMTANELKGTALSGQWRTKPGVMTTGPDGKVVFLFGATQPSVVCAPLQVCDIELEPGEEVRDVLVGDSVRWKVEAATSGATARQAVHLIVKPAEPSLATSMVVTTSRRTYHIQLKSHASQYMARIGFDYPSDISARISNISARLQAGGHARTAAGRPNFSYSLRGRAPWKPTRVYSDGVQTFIQFPQSISSQDAPVLFVISGGENRIVNYRMNGDMMIADYAIDRAILLSGSGWHRKKVIIERKG